jgi:transcriptional regulator GlxA family with amidase domain
MDQRVQIVIELMTEEFHQDILLSLLAASVNLSLSRLHHLFKSETGTTPAKYLRVLRMEKAKELLAFTFMSIKQIMVSVGVRDRSHFEREFKRIYQLTPTQYRANARLSAQQSKRSSWQNPP